ncbi:Uncharacterized membrane protein YccC [Luteibacter sp. UNCMF331Sha3.1]|uniref:FUSC family protein n=1 Tax=Luteibacter sp. UNCMF331Sha3.1 TaxID=1502760 RepID=UPI0008C54FE2|nr:FUSC family protein [Luteibacter sp. UNCMF331Sha3.1]SEN11466.1 Uncharacterized membrane protein YccC [Luteibacter sp. UNCMF331Sha3.1]
MDKRAFLFGLNCYIASIAALWTACCFELPNPWWAVLTVVLTSQPAVEGAIWAKAFFRVAGTLLGLAVALLIIPNLVDAPELMILALALWVGACVFFAVQDRSPANYALLLAGYGAVQVGLPVIDNPVNIFPTAVYRTEEILIGVVFAALAHGLLLPRSVYSAVRARTQTALEDIRQGLTAALSGRAFAGLAGVAQAAIDLHLLAAALGFETPRGRPRVATTSALAASFATLVPHIAGLSVRRLAPSLLTLPPAVETVFGDVAAWVRDPDAKTLVALDERLAALSPASRPDMRVGDVFLAGYLERLRMVLATLNDACALARALDGDGLAQAPLEATAEALALHRDPVVAAWSALNAVLAICTCGALALSVQWPPATIGIGIAAVLTSLFAVFDDPTPLMRRMLVWTLVSIPIGLAYVFAILPAVDGFVPLAIVLLPAIFIPAVFMAIPRHALRALATLLVTTTIIGLQPAYRGDLETFSNLALSSALGTSVALMVTQTFRVISATTQARRIHRAARRDLREMAGERPGPTFVFATKMLDRLLLESARLPGHDSALLRELRVGVNLAELAPLSGYLDEAGKGALASVRVHVRARPDHVHRDDGPPALAELVRSILRVDDDDVRRRAVTSWSGLHAALVER